MKHGAALCVAVAMLAGCGSTPRPGDVREAFARHGIELRAAHVHLFREAIRSRREWRQRVVDFLNGRPPVGSPDRYAFFTSKGIDAVDFFVIVESSAAEVAYELPDRAVRATERQGVVVERHGNVVVTFDRSAGARLRARIRASLDDL